MNSYLKYYPQIPAVSVWFLHMRDWLKRLFSLEVDGIKRTLVEQILIDEMQEQEAD